MIGLRIRVSLSRNGNPNRSHMGMMLKSRAVGYMTPTSRVGLHLGSHHGGWLMVKRGSANISCSWTYYIDISSCF